MLTASDRVLEIGPGTGVLTKRLLGQAGQVVAIEIDPGLCQRLAHQFSGDRFLLVQGDFLALNLGEQLRSTPAFQAPTKVVANIPYYITGPILEKLLGTLAQPNPTPFDTIVLLVQREMAERLSAQPGSRACGALSIKVQYLAECETVCSVPPKAFYPPPKVSSAVVRLRPRAFIPPAQDPQKLEQLVTTGFSSKRKMLRNNLSSLLDRSQLLALLAALNIPATARAEDLTVENWVTLSNKMLEETPLAQSQV